MTSRGCSQRGPSDTEGAKARQRKADDAAAPDREVEMQILSAMVDLCDAAVISADAAGRIRTWNPGAQKIFGYKASEVVGRAITRLIPPRLRRKHRALFQSRVDQQDERDFTRTLEIEGLRRDGREIPIEMHLVATTRGGRRAFAAIVRDLSEHRHIVEQLNDALQQLRFHVERMPLAHIVWDAEFTVVDWNPAATRVFGYSKKEALGMSGQRLVPPDARASVDRIWKDVIHGDPSSHSINVNVRKDGTRITCEWFNTPLLDAQGGIRGVASMAMDISERTAVEAQLRDAQKLESLGVLASGVAHDFNSLLTVIIANASLLRASLPRTDRSREYLDLIEQAGFRASELINRLMAYARSGRHSPQPTNLNEVIRETVPFLRKSIGAEHSIRTRLTPHLPEIRADRGQLDQILLNLCLNAQQAMADGGTIKVTTRTTILTVSQVARCAPPEMRPGKYVELTVADTGCGMSPDMAARIFDPFFSTKPAGHGLGMATVLGILRQHQGAARLETEVDRGTTVHVYFPFSKTGQDKS